MGRFGFEDADNYGGGGGGSYFSLKNDGDIARVRIMYNNMSDVTGYAVHQVEIGDKKRWVNCLRNYNEPKAKCPLCAANNFQRAKMFIPLYDVDDNEVKIWERGKNFFARISALCSRYANSETPLVAHVFEIERHGKKGDTSTDYQFFETSKDDTRMDDLPEVPDVVGSMVLDKTADEMIEYLNTGSFPDGNSSAFRRSEEDNYPRRTPARNSNTERF